MAIMARRGIVTQSSSSIQSSNIAEEHETYVADAKPVTDVGTMIENVRSNGTAVTSTTFSNLKISKHHNLAMIFTCKVCETRSMKTMCRESYEKGVVVARCGGCNNLHLIADHLGWFGEPGTIEELLASRGEEVKKGSFDTLNLTLEDIVGQMQCKDGD